MKMIKKFLNLNIFFQLIVLIFIGLFYKNLIQSNNIEEITINKNINIDVYSLSSGQKLKATFYNDDFEYWFFCENVFQVCSSRIYKIGTNFVERYYSQTLTFQLSKQNCQMIKNRCKVYIKNIVYTDNNSNIELYYASNKTYYAILYDRYIDIFALSIIIVILLRLFKSNNISEQ